MKALILSGGGARGAYQVGVLKRLVELDRRWDLIVGVSVGALNGGFLAQFAKDRQAEGVRQLEQFWLNLRGNQSVFKPWFFRELSSFWRGGMYNPKPLRKLIEANIDAALLRSSGVPLIAGVVSLERGDYMTVRCDAEENPHDWIMASASFPGAFPPVKIDGEHFTDGGVRCVTPYDQADLQERGLGADGGDIVLASPHNRELMTWPGDKFRSAVMVGLRSAEILSSEVSFNDIGEGFPDGWNLYGPQQNIIENALGFDPKLIRLAIRYGYESVKE